MNILEPKELQLREIATDICFKWLQGCGISWITMPTNLNRQYVRLTTSEVGSSQRLTLLRLTTSVMTCVSNAYGTTDQKPSRIFLEIWVYLPPTQEEAQSLRQTLTKMCTKVNGVVLKLLWHPLMTFAQRDLLITTNSVPSTQQQPCSVPSSLVVGTGISMVRKHE